MPNNSLAIDIYATRFPAEREVTDDRVENRRSVGREAAIKLLNESLAMALSSVLRYRSHHCMALTNHWDVAADVFMTHANEKLAYADRLAKRIVQLGGSPTTTPTTQIDPVADRYRSLASMIRDMLIASELATDGYHGMLQCLGESDYITRSVLEDMLAGEEKQAAELTELLLSRFRRNIQTSESCELAAAFQ